MDVTVDTLDFRRTGTQTYYCNWRNAERTMRFCGFCVVCQRRTYAFDDGENDPRGPLGDRAASPLVASENGMVGPDVPACFPCMNEEGSYRFALEIARGTWTDPEEQETT